MSDDLSTKIQLGIEELTTVREQLAPLIAMPSDSRVGDIETAAACAMLHSFYSWNKLYPLVSKVGQTYSQTRTELETFQTFLGSRSEPAS